MRTNSDSHNSTDRWVALSVTMAAAKQVLCVTPAILLIVLCGTLATTSVFGQTIYTFSSTNGADIGLAASWTPNGLPSGGPQDTAQWDNVTAGNLVVYYNTGWGNSGFGTSGVNLGCTVNQIGNLQITTTLSGSPAAGIFGITNNSPTAVLRIGESGTAHQLNFATRPGNQGTVHYFVNNSTNAAIHDSSITWVAGGGQSCVLDFGGTGDWIVNHNLRDNNSGAGPIWVTWEGPGTMTWSPGGTFLASDNLGPITINGGTVILKGAGLAQFSPPGFEVLAFNNSITNLGTLKYDAAAPDTISRYITGPGAVQVNNGTLTLSGANDYSGPTVLSGGELIVNSVDNGTNGPLGVGGKITFSGGTLGFGVLNTFDYSSRFSTLDGQQYKFDTGGHIVSFATGLSSFNGTLTQAGAGTLILSGASTYDGPTTVTAGLLVFQGSKSGSGNITVADGAGLGVYDTGTQVKPGTLTVGTSSGATLEFNNVTSTTTAPLSPGTFSSAGTVTININGGKFFAGQSYPLLAWTNGSAPAVSLGILSGALGNLSTNGNSIQLNVTQVALSWTGLNNANWDMTTPNNWQVNGSIMTYSDPSPVLFDDTAPGTTNVTLNSAVQPKNVTVNNNSLNYSITSSSGNDIAGAAALIKSGSGMLALSGGFNAYTGITTLRGGTLSVGTLANGGSASDIGASSNNATNVVLNGGTLQYTGGAASSDRLFTVGTAGGAVDASGSGALNLNNSGSVGLSGVGLRPVTLTGASAGANTLAAALGDAPAGGAVSLTKAGASTWVLTATNNYSGGTTISGGTLQIGAGGTSGSAGSGNILDNASLDFNRSGTLTVSGAISGTGSVTNDGSGTVILANNNTYTGGTTINTGTLQVGSGGGTGALDASSPIANNSTIIFNSTTALTLSGVISGPGNLIKRGSGLLKFIGNNTYTGTTTIDPGAQLQLWQGNTGANASSAITNNGTLIMMRQDNGVATYAGNISGTGQVQEQVSNGNGGDSTLTGTNTYTGGTYILGGGIVLGNNGVTPNGGSIVGNVFLTNDTIHATFGPFVAAIITFNRAEDVTFPGNIIGNGSLTQQGTDTLTLTGTNTYSGGTTITAGTLQVGTNGPSGSIGSGNVTDNSVLVFNRSDNVTYGGVISGAGSLVQEGAGTLTLSGANTYSGTTTLSNGTVVAASADTGGAGGPLGAVGTISLFGSTLAFSVNNAFDYSSRFDTSAGQVYSFDTAGQSVTFATGLSSIGGALTKAGAGTLTLAGASTYDGPTTVNAGLLVFQGTKSGSANITLADGAGLGVTEATGAQVTPGTLTLGTSGNTTLEFNNVTNTTTAALAAGTLSSAGTVTININNGTFANGQSYPLLAWTSGSAPAVSLGILNGALGNLSTNGNTIQLNITQVALAWTGLNNGNWDSTTANNWQVSGSPATYSDPAPVVFDDTATGTTTVTVNAVVQPKSIAVNNSGLAYSISSGSGNLIGGTASLTKSGTNTLTLSGGLNTNTGILTVRGGTVSVGALANGGSASDIGAASSSATNVVLNSGGTLQYTGGGSSSDRLFTLGTGGGALDASGAGALYLNNAGLVGQSGDGARTLTLTGTNMSTNTLTAALGNLVGESALSKTGPGTWVLAGTNLYAGGTTIAAGTLQVGMGGTNGSLGSGNVTNNSSLVFNRAGTLTSSGAISGTGSVTNNGSGTVILPGANTYTGGTTITAGTLQIGNGGATGSLDANSTIADNGILIFNSASTNTFTLSAASTISGTGRLVKSGSTLVKLLGAETYSGSTTINGGALLQIGEGTSGSFASPFVTNNGTLIFVRSDNGVLIINGNISGSGKVVKDVNNTNAGDVTLTGTNTFSGGTLINGGGIILGDGVSAGKGSIGTGNVLFTNSLVADTYRSLTFNRPDNFTFAGVISIATNLPTLANSGAVIQNGTGTVTLTGSNYYTAGTIINQGRLQLGAGGKVGSINGNVTNNGVLVFNRSDNVTFGGLISGSGAVVKTGSGTLTLPNANSYTGSTTVSNGTLIINGNNAAASTVVYAGTLGGNGTLSGPVALNAGTTLSPGGASVGTLTINSDLSIGGNLAIDVNKSLAQSNDLVVVSGGLTNTGTGTSTVKNLGPNLVPGDKFTLFSKPLQNGAALTLTGARATWANHLAVDGSISVISLAPPPTLKLTQIGNNLQFSWSDSYSTFKLQAQTNGSRVGLTTNWADYPGGGTSPVTVPIFRENNTFFRLKIVSTP